MVGELVRARAALALEVYYCKLITFCPSCPLSGCPSSLHLWRCTTRCQSPAVYASTQDSKAGWNSPSGFGLALERRAATKDHAESHTGTGTIPKACGPQSLTQPGLERRGTWTYLERYGASPPHLHLRAGALGWVTPYEACFFLSGIPSKCNGLCPLTPPVSTGQCAAGEAGHCPGGLEAGLSRSGVRVPPTLYFNSCTWTDNHLSVFPTAVGMCF